MFQHLGAILNSKQHAQIHGNIDACKPSHLRRAIFDPSKWPV